MSLANKKMRPVPVGDGSGKFVSIDNQYGNTKKLTRAFIVDGSSLNTAANIEALAFDDYGTLDGETTCPAAYQRTVRAEEKFPNCYLESQDAQPARKDGKDVLVTKVYQEAYETLREVEEPIKTEDEDGRKSTKRTFVILKANVPDPQIGEAITADDDDDTQVLIDQTVKEGKFVALVTRTFTQATDTPVQLGNNLVSYTENGLKVVEQRFYVQQGYDLDAAEDVGVTTGVLGEIDELYLSGLSFGSRNATTAIVVKRWAEAGVLSISESHRYGDSVEVYSVEGIKLTEAQARAAITDLPDTAKFYGSRISNYKGLQTTIYEFFTGSGVISTSISYSYNNKLTRTTIVSIDETPDTPVGSVLIDSKAETRDEFILYTYTFVEGQGVVSTNLSSKYNGELTVETVTSINEVPVIPAGYTTMEAQVREEDGYLLYTTTYASGAGVIGVSTDTKYDGKLILTTTTSLNQPPTGITNLIRSESSQSDYGTIYTYTTAVGTGEIGRSVDYKYDNTLTLTTVTSINVVPDEDGALVRSDVSDTDYGTIYTYTYAVGSGEIGRSTDSKYNGTLTLTTITSLNQTPSGTGAVIRSDSNETDYGTIYTYTFASGQGQIGESIENKYNGTLTLTTLTSLNAVPAGTGALIRSDSNDTDYGTIYTYTYAVGSGEIGRSTDYKYDNTLTLTTVTSINVVPDEDGVLIRSDVNNTDYGIIYTYTYADGQGEISRDESIRYQGKLKILSITYLNQASPATPAGYTLIRSENNSSDFGIILTQTYAEGIGQISSSKETRSDGSEINSYTILGNEEPTPPPNSYLIEKSYEAADGYDIYTYFYYSLPTDYNVPVSTTWKKPSILAWDALKGFYIGIAGGVQPAVGEAVVTFSTTQPSPLSLTNIDITATSNESVSYEDGSRLVRTSTWENTVANGAGGTLGGGSYLGAACLSGATSSSSEAMPSGAITVGWESVPYFYAGGTTVYKTTTTTINV